MISMIQSNLTNAYMMFVLDLGDPSLADKSKLEHEMKCPLIEVFDSQKSCDRAKRLLKDQFPKMLALYFNSFNGPDGLNYVRLTHEISKNKKNLTRHLGKDKIMYLTLITSLMAKIDNKRGLIFSVVS